MVRESNFKFGIRTSQMICRQTSGGHHLRNGINSNDLARRADDAGQTQRRLSGACSNIQNGLPVRNRRIVDESFGDRRKELPDHVAVLAPERRGTSPSFNNRLVWLHQRKYTGVVRRFMIAAVAARRLPKLTLECPIESSFGFVSDIGGDFRHAPRRVRSSDRAAS